MKVTQFAILAAAAVLISASTFAPSLAAQKALTLDLAQTMAQEAMAKCHADGYKVTVLVVDGLNEPKALARDDGAPASTAENAKMKATSALLYNRPSGPAQPLPAGAVAPPATIPGTSMAQGAAPIKVGDATIGAIAVSGTPSGDKDLACAEAALAKVADKLK